MSSTAAVPASKTVAAGAGTAVVVVAVAGLVVRLNRPMTSSLKVEGSSDVHDSTRRYLKCQLLVWTGTPGNERFARIASGLGSPQHTRSRDPCPTDVRLQRLAAVGRRGRH